ncbi:MAG: hypothetical protein H5U08_03535 [Thermogutta sp.]|uniref:hypothetical protein n=1 Tax=Thermogutta sp. TaxID=1962930 RepID=UPI0019B52846|nr:hypothetical protein [Thermogutta sp.]MBC7351408.1 hypothetical protein [Thermogutta sp.]
MTDSHAAIHHKKHVSEAGPFVTRRDFWRESFRAVALMALSATTVTLGLRRIGPQASVACRRSICNGCSRVAACFLPQAQLFRQSLRDDQANRNSQQEGDLKSKAQEESRKSPVDGKLAAARSSR